MRVWRLFAAAGVWLLAVLIVAGIAWFGIDSAGRQVGGPEGAVGLVVATGPATGTPSPGAAATRPGTGTPSPTSATTARDVTPSGGSSPSSSTRTPTPARTTNGGQGPGSPRPSPSVPGGGDGRTGTFSSRGGDVVVRCVGAALHGWLLRVADGWHAQAAPGPHGRLDVLFATRDAQTIQIQVSCRDGAPVFVALGQRPARR